MDNALLIALGFIVAMLLLKLVVTGIEDLINKRQPTEEQIEEDTHRVMNKPSKSTTMSPLVDTALDIYEQSMIKLPLDIIEELSYSEFKDVDEVIKFIEMQRVNWKFENQKKLLRR